MKGICDWKRWLRLPIGILRCVAFSTFMSLSSSGIQSLHNDLKFIKSFSMAPEHKSLNPNVNSH